MLNMLLLALTVNQNIIKEYQYKSPQKRLNDGVHESLEGSWSICQAKEHYNILKVPLMCSKGSLVYVNFIHSNLMITTPQI